MSDSTKSPDLLHLEPRSTVDRDLIADLLELAFMGREIGEQLDRALSVEEPRREGWRGDFFAEDLFLAELVAEVLELTSDGKEFRVNRPALVRHLSDPPTSVAGVEFRQEILRELDGDEALLDRLHRLYRSLAGLAGLLRLPGRQARIDLNAFRLEILGQARAVIEQMVAGFGEARSGLRRLAEAGRAIEASREYGLLVALLDYEERMSTLNVDIRVGASGRIRDLVVRGVAENRGNPFYSRPFRRLGQRLGFALRGYRWDGYLVVARLVERVFHEISPRLVALLELVGQLELYLTALQFRDRVRRQGLAMSLARVGEGRSMELDGLFNPLLLRQGTPVPCDVRHRAPGSVTLVTGPNSGGKTRLLQALGIAQLLGQSGLFAPAARAELPVLSGLYVSIIQREAADQDEGRLGRELMRIRAIFEAMERRSLVIFDELCSGTNPSEGIEVFSVVLRLLERVEPIAFICTHFLDYARDLQRRPPIDGLEFLRVEVGPGDRSTYQFVPGVAETSLAAAIAERLGVTFEAMAAAIDRRLGEAGPRPQRGEPATLRPSAVE